MWDRVRTLWTSFRAPVPPIPRIIHQTWKDAEVPDGFRPLVATWRERHPDWEYRLWTDDDLLDLIRSEGPALHDLYVSLPHTIQRVDLGRYVILRRFGGMYVDLDFECLRPVDSLLEGGRPVIGLEPPVNAERHGKTKILCNALLAFPPRDPLLDALLDEIPEALDRFGDRPRNDFILETTGPFMLTRVFDGLPRRARRRVALYDHRYFYPLTYRQVERLREDPEDERLLKRLDDAYAVHLFEGTWWKVGDLKSKARPRAVS